MNDRLWRWRPGRRRSKPEPELERGGLALPSLDLRRRYEPDWIELDGLIDQVQRDGLSGLTAMELRRLVLLYRRTIGSLALAREVILDRALVAYLESLAARAYLALHGSSLRQRSLVDLFLRRIPRAVRSVAAELGLAFTLLALGIALGAVMTLADPEWFFAFVPEGLARGLSPAHRTLELEASLYEAWELRAGLSEFTAQLFVHNVEVCLFAFALGFMLGVPTAYLIFANGLTLGAYLALFFERDLGLSFLGWLLPHGVPELGAAVLCGGAGLALARAIVFPGERTPLRALQEAGRRVALVVAAAVCLLLVAALFEGLFRQLVVDDAWRFCVAAFNAGWIAVWLIGGGREPRPGQAPEPEVES